MLTDRQLADIQADVEFTLNNKQAGKDAYLLARHGQYLLDEVARLRQWDQDRWLLKKWDEQNGRKGV